MNTDTTNSRVFRLVVCGVCDGHGSIIRTDWSSTEFPPRRKTSTCWCCKGEGKHPVLPDDYDAWLLTLDAPDPQPRALAAVQTLVLHGRQVQIGDVFTVTNGAHALRGRYAVKRVRPLSDGRTILVLQMFSITGEPFSGYHVVDVNTPVTVDRV